MLRSILFRLGGCLHKVQYLALRLPAALRQFFRKKKVKELTVIEEYRQWIRKENPNYDEQVLQAMEHAREFQERLIFGTPEQFKNPVPFPSITLQDIERVASSPKTPREQTEQRRARIDSLVQRTKKKAEES